MSGRIGERVMGENVSIWDDGLAADRLEARVTGVVVRDRHHVDAREGIEGDPGRIESSGPDPRGGSGPLAPVGIREDADAVHLDQQIIAERGHEYDRHVAAARQLAPRPIAGSAATT